jgi:Ca2+-transporting ATPase
VITLAVVATNAGLGFFTESGSERIIRSMTGSQSSHVMAMRNNAEILVEHDALVPGDVILLKPNTVILADARLISTRELQVNEAILTGESEPVEKHADQICGAATNVAERVNLVHKGSFVVSGTGRAIVVATGRNTQAGQIETALGAVSTPKTPLEKDLDNLGAQLVAISVAACGAFIIAGSLRGRALPSMLKSGIALAVAAVPEGLPTTATTTLALGLRQLREKGVIVRRLAAVEGLGSLQVICFDKTGTITQNRMQVQALHIGTDRKIFWDGEAPPLADCPPLERLHEISVLCCEVEFETDEEGLLAPAGSATETALVNAALEAGINPISERQKWPAIETEFRSESRRFMRSVHGAPEKRTKLVALKGDPHQVLQLCRRVLLEDGKIATLKESDRCSISATVDSLAGKAFRVLGFAYEKTGSPNPKRDNLIWVGAAAMKDPVVPGAKDLMVRLRQAGIRPVMITGDQAATAEAIAVEVGLRGDEPLRVLDSGALDKVPPELLNAIAQKTDVFARTPPTRKLRIVEALQGAGLTVGMTGDGFNDAPALKAADIAVAVGMDSATAARDVADVIIDEQRLEALADGVEQGRTILSNIRKAIHYIISTNLSEIIVLIAESTVANDELESPMELLWLNLVTDILPGLGLALEPPERHIMRLPPRSQQEALFGISDLRHSALEGGIIGASALGAHAYGLARYGPGPQTRSVTFMSLVASQLLHALACRYDRFVPLGGRALFGNQKLNMALAGAAGLQVLAIASPTLRRILGIAPPRALDLAVAGGAAMASFAVNETTLALRTRNQHQPSHEQDRTGHVLSRAREL